MLYTLYIASAQYRATVNIIILYCVRVLLLFNQLRGAGDVDSEETGGDSMIVSSSTIMFTEVRLLIVCTIVDAFS
jgi:hypothetical protein